MSLGKRSFGRMRWTALIVSVLMTTAGLAGVSAAQSSCDVTLDDTQSVQAATDAASSGDVICLEAGDYDEGSTSWEIDTPLTLRGLDGSDAVTIDRSAASGTRGIVVTADAVTLEGFTLQGPLQDGPVEYGLKVEFVSDLVLDDVHVVDSGRTGIDLHGVDGAVLSGVGARNNLAAGIAMTDSSDVRVEDASTSGNAWGGLAIWTSGGFTAPGVSDVSVVGSTFTGEPAGIFLEDSDDDPAVGFFEDISLEGNTLEGNGAGVFVGERVGGTVLHFNRIVDNSVGVLNGSGNATLDATHNWWGSPLGPDDGATQGDVDSSRSCVLESCSVQEVLHTLDAPPHHA